MSQLRSAYTWPQTPLHEDSDPLLAHSSLRGATDTGRPDGLLPSAGTRDDRPKSLSRSQLNLDNDADIGGRPFDRLRSSSIASHTLDDATQGIFQDYLLRATPGFGIHRTHSDASIVLESGVPKIEPIHVPPGYPKLDYLPVMPRTYVTIPLACFYLFLMAGMVAARLLMSDETVILVKNVDLYLVARYGLAVIGVISTILFKSVADQLRRMLPYIHMCDHRGRATRFRGTASVGAQYWPLHSTIDTPLSAVLWVLSRITAFLISYKTLLIQVVEQESGWAVVVHRRVLLGLISYYAVVGLFMLFLTFWLWGRETGLREGWDPQSFSDVVSLFFWSGDYKQDVHANEKELRIRLRTTRYRLGYRNRSVDGESKVIYGVLPLEDKQPLGPRKKSDLEPTVHGQGAVEGKRDDSKYPYKFHPMLSKPYMVFYMGTVSALLGLLVYAGVHGTIWSGFAIRQWHLVPNNSTIAGDTGNLTLSGQVTFTGQDPQSIYWATNAKANDLIWASFLFRALPIGFIAIALGYLTNFDAHFRYMQPIYNMTKRPQKSSESVLLSYLSMSVLGVT